MVDKTRQTLQTEVDKMEEMPITRDLAELVQALHDEADYCELLGITKPAAMLREAAAVIQVDANMQAMDEFAEVASVGHLSELVDDMRRKLHALADDVEDQEEIRGDPLARDLRAIAGDMHPPIPMLARKAERVHELVNAGPCHGMSEAFNAHMGAACWTDPAYAPDASMWAAAWKASFRARACPTQDEPVYDFFGNRWPA
jgi:hypothetical protein